MFLYTVVHHKPKNDKEPEGITDGNCIDETNDAENLINHQFAP
jgi:hypothetical protein